MCECGCASGPDVYFPGPRGTTYALEIYRGCDGCGNPAGITLYAIPDDQLEHFGPLEWAHEVPWVKPDGWREFSVGIIGRGELQEMMATAGLDEFDAEEGTHGWRQAVAATLTNTDAEIQRTPHYSPAALTPGEQSGG